MNKLLEALKSDKRNSNWVPKFFMKDEGDYWFRILPNLCADSGLPFIKQWMHVCSTEDGKISTLRCIGKSTCPVCMEANAMNMRGEEDAWKYRARPQFLYWILMEGKVMQMAVDEFAQNAIVDKLFNLAKVNPGFFEDNHGVAVKMRMMKDKNKRSWRCDLETNNTQALTSYQLDKLNAVGDIAELYPLHTVEELCLKLGLSPIQTGGPIRAFESNKEPTVSSVSFKIDEDDEELKELQLRTG